jgi:hypothetical protein
MSGTNNWDLKMHPLAPSQKKTHQTPHLEHNSSTASNSFNPADWKMEPLLPSTTQQLSHLGRIPSTTSIMQKPPLTRKQGIQEGVYDIYVDYKSYTDETKMQTLGASIHNNSNFGTNYHSLFNTNNNVTKGYDYNYIITYYKNNLVENYIDNVLKAYIKSITDKYDKYPTANKIAEWLNPFTNHKNTLEGMIHTVLLYEFDYFIYLLQNQPNNDLIKNIINQKVLKLRLIYFHSLLKNNKTIKTIDTNILNSRSATSKYLKYKMKYIALKKKLNL